MEKIKIRYQTPTGMVAITEIRKPDKELTQWAMKGYIRRELQARNIEYKSKPKIIES